MRGGVLVQSGSSFYPGMNDCMERVGRFSVDGGICLACNVLYIHTLDTNTLNTVLLDSCAILRPVQ